jgi:23S rRNA (cytosine1962-C5)-methyltransferase
MQALLHAIATMAPALQAQRVFHGRGGLHPGEAHWTLDAYPPCWVLTSFQAVAAEDVATVQAALAARCAQLMPEQPLNLVFQCRDDGPARTELLTGSVPDPHDVWEAGSCFRVHVLRGQNHGLFLDMAEGRQWVRSHALAHPGLKVLNLFAYTCAFSLAALQGGAESVVNVDMSAGALAIGRQNHALNGVSEGASFLAHDVFNSWGKLTRGGPYGLVILDPPSHQKGSFVATKDYARLVRRLPDLLEPGGHALLCLNTPKLGEAFLHGLLQTEAPALQLLQRLPNPAAFADANADRALKVLVVKRSS